MALRAGIPLQDPEFVQFHPTGTKKLFLEINLSFFVEV